MGITNLFFGVILGVFSQHLQLDELALVRAIRLGRIDDPSEKITNEDGINQLAVIEIIERAYAAQEAKIITSPTRQASARRHHMGGTARRRFNFFLSSTESQGSTIWVRKTVEEKY